MSVRRQLLFGFGTLVLIMLLTGIVSVGALRTMSSSQAVVVHDVAGKVTAIDQLQTSGRATRRDEPRLLADDGCAGSALVRGGKAAVPTGAS